MDETPRRDHHVRVVGRSDQHRMTPLRGTKAWFGPRRMGWGWEPVSWEGWLSTSVALVLIIVPVAWAATEGTEDLRLAAWIVGVAAALVLISRAKGTSPGGPSLRRQFDRTRKHEEHGRHE